MTLPEDYKWFLEKFGHGGALGVEILGCADSLTYPVVDYTIRYRVQFSLPENFVVIEDCDEFAYCLDIGRLVDQECPIMVWDRRRGLGPEVANSFLEFFDQELVDAEENLASTLS